MKHTPGPWTLAHNWRGKMAICGPRFAYDPEGHSISSLTVDRICNVPHRPDRAGAANARLIAQAPAMYEALKALILWERRLPDGDYKRDIAAARAALALVDQE
jgi:hypothetical protein